LLDNQYGRRVLIIGKQLGVTLIELIVSITIISILLMLAIPSYRTWVQHQQVRAGAESILNGLRLARNSAVSNNAMARFVLCDANNSTTTWEVLAASATAAAPTASFACAGASPGSNAAAGDIRVQERSAKEGSKSVQIIVLPTAAPVVTMVTFNSLGRVMNLNPVDNSLPFTQITICTALDTSCNNADLSDRPLQINVKTGGDTRMCDPSPLLATSDPRHC
jgi:type IV fimbrial biogenesis protein FimT